MCRLESPLNVDGRTMDSHVTGVTAFVYFRAEVVVVVASASGPDLKPRRLFCPLLSVRRRAVAFSTAVVDMSSSFTARLCLLAERCAVALLRVLICCFVVCFDCGCVALRAVALRSLAHSALSFLSLRKHSWLQHTTRVLLSSSIAECLLAASWRSLSRSLSSTASRSMCRLFCNKTKHSAQHAA